MSVRSHVLPRLAALAAAVTVALGAGALVAPVQAAPSSSFDLQSHRGGRGEHTEESLYGFARSIELGVTTLELDVVLTKDAVPLIWHDPTVQADKCSDTAPATPGDKQFPYVGKVIHDLTYARSRHWCAVRSSRSSPPRRRCPTTGSPRCRSCSTSRARVPGQRPEVQHRDEDRGRGAREVGGTAGFRHEDPRRRTRRRPSSTRVAIQSFDWRSLPLVRAQAPSVPLVALYDATTWKKNSAWLGPVSYEKFDGDVVRAVKAAGFEILSPDYELSDRKTVTAAHAAGLKVIPWTVNESWRTCARSWHWAWTASSPTTPPVCAACSRPRASPCPRRLQPVERWNGGHRFGDRRLTPTSCAPARVRRADLGAVRGRHRRTAARADRAPPGSHRPVRPLSMAASVRVMVRWFW